MRMQLVPILICVAAATLAAEPETAWRLDFSDRDEIDGVHYVVADQQTQEGMIFDIRDGVLTFGVEFDDDSGNRDHGVLAWGESMPYGFWQWKASPFEPIDPAQFPIVELRARKAPGLDPSVTLAPTYDTDVGRKFSQLGLGLTNEWQTYTFRFSPFSSVPGATTPRSVTGMVFWVHHHPRPAGLQIDWLRVRAFTAEEQARDDMIVNLLEPYQAPEWQQPFFIYGPYSATIRGTARQGGFEGAYGNMVRPHMNYMMCPHDISNYRFGSVAEFLEVDQRAVEAAATVGLTLSLDVRAFAWEFNEHGIDYIRPGVATVAEAFRGNPAVLGYTLADEPKTSGLVEIVAVKQLFEQADPAKLCAFPLNSPYWANDFAPYSTIVVGDHYPITLDGRDPGGVAHTVDEYIGISKKPVWFIIQAIGEKPWWPRKKGGYALPTAAEFRRMAFMCIGRGVKGLMFYNWYGGPWVTLVDRYGNPGPLYGTASRLGERLATVGSVLLRAQYSPENSLVASATEAQPFEVFALELEQPQGVLYVACNTDLEKPHTLDIEVPGPQSDGVLLDLESLMLLDNRLYADQIAPGDGHFFAAVKRDDSEALAEEILENRQRETERAARPDRAIARRWNDQTDEMRAIDTELDIVARQLGEIEKATSAGVNTPRAGMEASWNRCMELGKAYDRLRSRWIAADREALAETVSALSNDVTMLSKAASSAE